MNELFPVVILAGGLATRLYPVTKTMPKSLITVNNEPFILHQLRWLEQQKIRKVTLCVGYLGEQIEALVGDGRQFNMQVQFVYDGEKLKGTGGAIAHALDQLSEHFFVLYGDSYLTCDFKNVQKRYIAERRLGLMTVFRNNGQWDNSNVVFDGQEIIKYDKQSKDRFDYIDYGLGVLSKRAFMESMLSAPFDLATLYQFLLHQKQLSGYEVTQRFYEIGSFAGIKELEYHLSQ